MEGLLSIAQDFLRDGAALARAAEIDRQREGRIGALAETFDAFRRGELPIDELVRRATAAVHEVYLARGTPVPLWGFKNEDERAFPERLGQAAARIPEVDLSGVLKSLLRDAETIGDDERVNRLLAFADFVADVDSRGAEGDPRLGVGPSANFLTFAWHALAQGREPVFLFDSNKALKAVSEGSGDARLAARDLEGRFRAFYLVARTLQRALAAAPASIRPGWGVEHVLAWTLERIGVVAAVPSGLVEDPGASGLWQPRPRSELRAKPPSGRAPKVVLPSAAPPGVVAPAQAPKATVRIEPPKVEAPKIEAPKIEAPKAEPRERDRVASIAKAKTIMADDAKTEKAEKGLEPDAPRGSEVREIVTPRSLPRIASRKAHAPEPPAPEPPRVVEKAKEGPKEPVKESAKEPVKDEPLRDRRSETSGELLSAALGELIGEIATAASAPEPAAPAGPDVWRPERLARDLGVAERLVANVLDALATRGRVVLAGPLSVGKTWLARRLALHVAGRDERVTVLRLHPAVTYGELVEAVVDGNLERGIVRELVDRARKERDQRFVLVLDEVDRGDLASALGELSGALAERGAEVLLVRSRERVSFPRNLHVIATARTVPHELLGRFPIVEVEPDEEVLRRFLARTRPALEWVADLLRETNVRLARERGGQARLGHGVLMDAELEVPRLEGIWRREVLPYVQSLGLEPRAFDLAALRKT